MLSFICEFLMGEKKQDTKYVKIFLMGENLAHIFFSWVRKFYIFFSWVRIDRQYPQ